MKESDTNILYTLQIMLIFGVSNLFMRSRTVYSYGVH